LANREIVPENQRLVSQINVKKSLQEIVVIITAGVFIGFLAPFGMDTIPVIISISYWCVVCLSGYLIYSPIIFVGENIMKNTIGIYGIRVAISAFVASILMSFAVPIIGWMFFDFAINFSNQFLNVFSKTIVIGGVLTFISIARVHFSEQKIKLNDSIKQIEAHENQLKKPNNIDIEKLTSQIPIEKRGKVLCLEMSDHYVKVHTTKGHHLVLMRFKDALDILQGYPGFQTHRSWWVAEESIKQVVKEGRKTVLLLQNEIHAPVSKTYAEKVKNRLATL